MCAHISLGRIAKDDSSYGYVFRKRVGQLGEKIFIRKSSNIQWDTPSRTKAVSDEQSFGFLGKVT